MRRASSPSSSTSWTALCSSKSGRGASLLTARESEIVDLLAAGKTNAEIAELLWIAPGTVRKHLENVYEKLGVHSRTAAVAMVRSDRTFAAG